MCPIVAALSAFQSHRLISEGARAALVQPVPSAATVERGRDRLGIDLRDRGPSLLPRLASPVSRALAYWGVPRAYAIGKVRMLNRHAYIPRASRFGMRTGYWESDEIKVALRTMDPSLPLLEIGGGLGIASCFYNRMLDDPKDHAVVELDAKACEVIAANRALNGAAFRVIHAALGYSGVAAEATRTGGFDAGQGIGSAAADVPRRTLAELAAGLGWSRFNLVMDIEGLELDVIAREGAFLGSSVAMVSMEIHPAVSPADAILEGFEALRRRGFHIADWIGSAVAFRGRAKGG